MLVLHIMFVYYHILLQIWYCSVPNYFLKQFDHEKIWSRESWSMIYRSENIHLREFLFYFDRSFTKDIFSRCWTVLLLNAPHFKIQNSEVYFSNKSVRIYLLSVKTCPKQKVVSKGWFRIRMQKRQCRKG